MFILMSFNIQYSVKSQQLNTADNTIDIVNVSNSISQEHSLAYLQSTSSPAVGSFDPKYVYINSYNL